MFRGPDVDLLQWGRDSTATAPNRKWVADITYLRTEQRWVYLAVVLDLFTGKIVGWSICNLLTTDAWPVLKRRMTCSWRISSAAMLSGSNRSPYARSEHRSMACGPCDRS